MLDIYLVTVCAVPEIALKGDCSYGDVCRDVNAECRTDSCQCLAGYTQRYGRCGRSSTLSYKFYPTIRLRVLLLLLPPDRGAEYCDQPVCLCVCLSVREHISGTAGPNLTKLYCADLL